MNRLLKRSAAALILAWALAACAMFVPPETRMSFGMLPANELGYEVDSSGAITVEARTLVFSNPAGMPATSITGYRLAYFNQSGALLGQTPSTPQSLNIYVPGGFQCTEPDPVLGCNLQSEGSRPAQGPTSTSEALQSQLLNADIVNMHIAAGFPTGWYADITFYGHGAAGEFQETYRVNIMAPN